MYWSVSTRHFVASREPSLRPATLGAVAFGGMIGAAARVFLPWPLLFGSADPLLDPAPTALVNLLGAALLGFVIGYTALRQWPEPLVKGISTGCLGAFTTMSTLALIYTGWTLGQSIAASPPLDTLLYLVPVITLGLVLFLWVTTVLTMWTYKLGRRLAARTQ